MPANSTGPLMPSAIRKAPGMMQHEMRRSDARRTCAGRNSRCGSAARSRKLATPGDKTDLPPQRRMLRLAARSSGRATNQASVSAMARYSGQENSQGSQTGSDRRETAADEIQRRAHQQQRAIPEPGALHGCHQPGEYRHGLRAQGRRARPRWSAASRFWLSLYLPSRRFDGQLEADNGAQQAVDIAGGRIADLPGLGPRRFMGVAQRGDMGAQPVGILDPADACPCACTVM